VLAERGIILDQHADRVIGDAGIDEVKVRSAMTCELVHGICATCYGMDLGRGAG